MSLQDNNSTAEGFSDSAVRGMLWQNTRLTQSEESDVQTDSAQMIFAQPVFAQSYHDTHSSNSLDYDDSDINAQDVRSRNSDAVEDDSQWDHACKSEERDEVDMSEDFQFQKASNEGSSDARVSDAGCHEDDLECRICRGGVECGVLLYPCKCSGSIRYVHQECLDAWLARTGSTKCELCHQPFIFSPVYAPNAPERLSPYEFTAGLLDVLFKKVIWYLRLNLIAFLWIVFLPVGTSWICRLYFMRSLYILSHFRNRMQVGAIVADWMQGVLLSLLVVTVFLAVSALRDYMLRQERLHQHLHNRQQYRIPAPNRFNLAQPARRQFEPENEEGAEEPFGAGGNEEFDMRNDNVNFNQEADRNFPIREVENQEVQNDDPLVGFLDGREEIPLEEFIGINGPLPLILENFLTVLISNAIFIGMLTFIPFSIGRSILWFKHNWKVFFDITFTEKEAESAYYGDGVTLLTGYATIIFILLDVILVSLVFGTRQEWFSPHSPLHRQVTVLLLIELVAFPTGCGWWCNESGKDGVHAAKLLHFSIPVIFDLPVRVRVTRFRSHWAVGVAFMVHVAVLVAVLREVVKPEVLWFLRNPEDAIEHPLRDLIDEPIPKHARRIVLCTILYLPLTVILIHLPLALADAALPGLFPVRFRFYNPIAEVPPYILLLHISFPLLMETFAPRDFFKTLLRAWLEAVGTALDIRDRVLPQDQIDEGARAQDQAEEPAQDHVQDQASANERSSEADILQEDQSDGREKRSILKESLLMLHLACLSIALVGGFSVIVPLLVGRQILAVLGVNECNDMYAYSIGFSSTVWLWEGTARLRLQLQQHEFDVFVSNTISTMFRGLELACIFLLLGGFLPFLLGLLLDLVFTLMLRVGWDQAPAFHGLLHWMVGLLVLKVTVRVLLAIPSLAPHWSEKLQHLKQMGLRNVRLSWVMRSLAVPLLSAFSMLLAVPYALAWGLMPVLGFGARCCSWYWRVMYPGGAMVYVTIMGMRRTRSVLGQLHDSLRDSMYLVGRRLHNQPS
ncbi:hypothetical protein GUITHDRAFT_160839 [Guillardia theta CCMP2712]|uniref:RING-type E3 ubiquitin transferase n=1 Tax=Guillardia theta (strain CCMP2712) TaxID=905079 RepID=L1K0S9_GUITC|nr:hypothetical protein GUITHDRAFT_160839 [Guillardia theta CCMP2712]EKX54212.1 hypothetical protein GUITHDRAFT_160839 [Guillardia theta CCMP2712]|eukprot:XP_005841192.1 hypothetical protein GUITHDRAFT_160839 [Guillardia theta CCMP2712]